MRFRKGSYIIILLNILTTIGITQNWGGMQLIDWFNPPNSFMGYFNPSYCDAESLLYFDDFYRMIQDHSSQIYSTKIDTIYFYQMNWTDPIPLPYPINIEGYLNAMACVNETNDTMYFASNRPGTRGGMDLWYSIKISDDWQEPVNLGDSINTEYDEFKPYYAKNSGLLFYERSPVSWHNYIYVSEIQDGVWQAGEILPDVINNNPGNYTMGTFFDETESALYYSYHYPDSISRETSEIYF